MTDWLPVYRVLCGYPAPVPDHDGLGLAMECPVRGCEHGVTGIGSSEEFRREIHGHMNLMHPSVQWWRDPGPMRVRWRMTDELASGR
jgi:hypothetical protein